MSTCTAAHERLRSQHDAFIKRWIASGKKATSWTCPHCDDEQITTQPTQDDVGSKGYWDSAKTCTACGHLSFVEVFPDGTTGVRLMNA